MTKAVYRKIQEVGLQTRYLNDLEFSLLLKMLPDLAYLPPQHVVQTFESLKTQVPHVHYRYMITLKVLMLGEEINLDLVIRHYFQSILSIVSL